MLYANETGMDDPTIQRTNFNFRSMARDNIGRAKELIAKNDSASLRYTCLELRFCIEHITLSQLQSYLAETSNDAIRKWTPKQIISELLEVDPHADKTATIAYGVEEIPGVDAKEMKVLGEDRRLSLSEANKSYNVLGSFLHALSLYQIEQGKTHSSLEIQEKAQEILNRLEKVLDSPLFNVNFGYFYEFDCTCGAKIRRRDGSFSKEKGIVCPKCSAIYDIASEEGDIKKFQVRQTEFQCSNCHNTNYVGQHLINVGKVLVCASCEARTEIVFALRAIEVIEKEETAV